MNKNKIKITSIIEFPLDAEEVFRVEDFKSVTGYSLGESLGCKDASDTYRSILKLISSLVLVSINTKNERLGVGIGVISGFELVYGRDLQNYSGYLETISNLETSKLNQTMGFIRYLPANRDVVKGEVGFWMHSPVLLSVHEIRASNGAIDIREIKGSDDLPVRVIKPWGKTDHLPEQMKQIAAQLEKLSKNFKSNRYDPEQELNKIVQRIKRFK